ncbi:hypothetical protein GCM10022255_091100 [Dactylosporangium darangshiense]|uniref:Gfo/Idh/MocA-like oxidoreductase C-terminal domain-containing protein n=1 Tax=Dactylosporangium darangshiense TaxID=579108 RepID=A0ABP8DP82_9ACTN
MRVLSKRRGRRNRYRPHPRRPPGRTSTGTIGRSAAGRPARQELRRARHRRSDHTAGGGHGGGDARLVAAFVDAVASDDPSRVLSGARDSLLSHLTVFAAEDASRTGAVVTVPN